MKQQWSTKALSAILIVMLALAALPLTPAYAAVATVTAFFHAPSGTAGPISITNANFSCAAGTNRLLVAVVTAEYNNASAMTLTANKGAGVNFTQAVVTTQNTRTNVWIGYLTETQIAGNVNPITVTETAGGATWTSSDVYLTCLSGVDQTTPIVAGGTAQN
ncbi:MAG TPA: hypothetical protein PK078_13775, partial [Anaerolineales bacterium]|nr:hypothetical protein [Anaerolineales bacterium]